MPVYATGFLERVLAPVSGLCVVSIIFWQAYCLFSHLCAVCRLSTDNWEVNRRCSQLHAVWLWQLQLSRACSRAWDHRLPLSFSCESRLAACFCFGFIVKPPPQSEGLTRLQRPYSICLFVHILSEMSMVCSTKVLCPQNLSEKIAKIQRSHVPIMWTYNICAFDNGTYSDYYWRNQDILQWCKQNKHLLRITGSKYSMLLFHQEVT